MQYISTRGSAPVLGFQDAVLSGLARDGGLYVPQSWPHFDADAIASFANLPYAEVAKRVLAPFVDGEIAAQDFDAMVEDAYGSFHHRATAPLIQLEPGHFILELFHGPTLAFKDVAMQLLGRMMDYILKAKGQRATIIGATSGDTGGAAIEAFRGLSNVDIFILFPHGKVSPVQQKQMTTVEDDNVHALAIEGNFDDCQALVKGMFNHHAFRDRYHLAGVNSINWARIMAQIVYYFSAGSALGAPGRKLAFCVPTGNFGDIFAGYCAGRMGLDIDKLIIATNHNDILTRTLETGRYEIQGVNPSTSPSMDIQVSSNFERLLFEYEDRSPDPILSMMASLNQNGAFNLSPQSQSYIERQFLAGRCSEQENQDTIADCLNHSGYLADPHTAVAIKVARENMRPDRAIVSLATAHPAKFPDAVNKACGIRPELPSWNSAIMEKEERFSVIENSSSAVESFIANTSRVQ